MSIKNTRLVFKQGMNDPFGRGKRQSLEIPANAANFDRVVIQGKGYVSTEALERLAEANINVIMLDKRGKLYSYFHRIGGYEPFIRQKQYDCFRNEEKVEYLRKWLVSQKIESQIQFFRELSSENVSGVPRLPYRIRERIGRSAEGMSSHAKKLENAHTLREIMKVEADAGKLYYPTFADAFRPEFGFHSRNNARSYRPAAAADVINGLLNYGFSILCAEVAKQLNALGLDCFVGFYHKSHESRLALVYDMIEPFRHLVDRAVFEIQDGIRQKDYIFSRQGIVVLSDDLKKRYIELLSSIFDRKRDYKGRSGMRREDGYQRMEEMTILKMKCISLRDLIHNKNPL